MPDTERMSHEEKREVALGVFSGAVFTSAQIRERDAHLTKQIFYVLLMLNEEQRRAFAERDVGVLWERMSEAAPVGLNGYPMFASVRIMCRADWAEVKEMVSRLQEAAKAL